MTRSRDTLRATLANLGWLSMGRILGDIATFALVVMIARWHGEAGLGEYAFAMAVTQIFAVSADFGIYNMFLREFAHRQGPMDTYFGSILSLGIVLGVLAGTFLIITIMIIPWSAETRWIMLLVGLSQLCHRMSEGYSYAFLVTQQPQVGGCIEAVSKTLAALLSCSLIVVGLPLPAALAALPCVAAGRLVAVYHLMSTRIGRPPLSFRISEMVSVLKDAGKYAISVLQTPIHARADVVTLGLILDAAAVGIYNAAFRIVSLLNVVAHQVSLALFPLVTKLHATSEQDVGIAYHAAVRASLLITLPAAAGLYLIAPKLIDLVFGPNFLEATDSLRILCCVVVLFPLRSLGARFLMASGLQGTRAKIEALGTATTVVGCLLLVTTVGMRGAAIAVLFAEALMVVLMARRLARLWGWPNIASRILMTVVGIVGFAVPILLWPESPLFLVIPLSVLIYVGTLALSSDIRHTEYRSLWTALQRSPTADGGWRKRA